MAAQAICDFKISSILMYMVFNGKGILADRGLHGYWQASRFKKIMIIKHLC